MDISFSQPDISSEELCLLLPKELRDPDGTSRDDVMSGGSVEAGENHSAKKVHQRQPPPPNPDGDGVACIVDSLGIAVGRLQQQHDRRIEMHHHDGGGRRQLARNDAAASCAEIVLAAPPADDVVVVRSPVATRKVMCQNRNSGGARGPNGGLLENVSLVETTL